MHLGRIFEFYVRSSLHVALAVLSLLYANSRMLKIPIDTACCLSVFLGTVGAYNSVKHFPTINRMPIPKLILTISSFVGVVVFGWLLSFQAQIWIFVCGLLIVLYIKSLRYAGAFIKILTISICWLIISMFLPWSNYTRTFFFEGHYTHLLGVLFFVLALMIPFELRDMHIDFSSVKTLPFVLGIKGSKVFGIFCSMGFLICIGITLANIVVTVMTILSISFSGPVRGYYYSGFFVEAIPIFWALWWLLC